MALEVAREGEREGNVATGGAEGEGEVVLFGCPEVRNED